VQQRWWFCLIELSLTRPAPPFRIRCLELRSPRPEVTSVVRGLVLEQ
jgi:hypothetical protein